MTDLELSRECELHVEMLGVRIRKLETELETASVYLRESIEDRIKMLSAMREEAIVILHSLK